MEVPATSVYQYLPFDRLRANRLQFLLEVPTPCAAGAAVRRKAARGNRGVMWPAKTSRRHWRAQPLHCRRRDIDQAGGTELSTSRLLTPVPSPFDSRSRTRAANQGSPPDSHHSRPLAPATHASRLPRYRPLAPTWESEAPAKSTIYLGCPQHRIFLNPLESFLNRISTGSQKARPARWEAPEAASSSGRKRIRLARGQRADPSLAGPMHGGNHKAAQKKAPLRFARQTSLRGDTCSHMSPAAAIGTFQFAIQSEVSRSP